MDIHPQSGALGAELRGIDLSKPIPTNIIKMIQSSFLKHQVIFFRGQSLSPRSVLEFASLFGKPVDYPFAAGLPDYPLVTEITKAEHETINFGGEWHSDTTYLEVPPCATILYAKQVPESGGDTLFANTYKAFEDLSEGMKLMLGKLKAVNTAGLLPREKRDGYAAMTGTNVDKLGMSATHPVVRTHPETHRHSLYINETHTSHFAGMTRDESWPLISYLSQQASRPEICFRLQWTPGTLTMWDNRCTQHYAINDYHGSRRMMYRVIVEGDRPV